MPSKRTAGGCKSSQAGRSGLGKAIDNDRRRKADLFAPQLRGEKSTGVAEGQAGRSVLEQSSLDDFLAQAALSSATFEAERYVGCHRFTEEGPRLVRVQPEDVGASAAASERVAQAAKRIVVPIPWRPVWQESQDGEDLARREGEAFLDWRRDLALLEEKEGVVMTPYERNLDFWRQLWRCVERSDLLIQIVDARDPDFYRSRDLERYVLQRFEGKKQLLLMNKSDFLSPDLRRRWAAHFATLGVDVIFFSALRELHRMQRVPLKDGSAPTAAVNGDRRGGSEQAAQGAEEAGAAATGEQGADESAAATAAVAALPPHGDFWQLPPHGDFRADGGVDGPAVLDCAQLLEEIRERLPEYFVEGRSDRRGTVGFVGYPNVGKSSVINALFGAKKVSMSRTPGKTKHLQTLDLPGCPDITLCDCPGLVFPSVVATKGHLAINGTVPLVELRDCVQPVRLVVDKIGVDRLAEKYQLTETALREGAARIGAEADPARRLLAAFAVARQHVLRLGVPDESWAARRVLHDYCTGELLHCETPLDDTPSVASATPSATARGGAAMVAIARGGTLFSASDGISAVATPAAVATDASVVAAPAEKGDDSDFSDLDAFLSGEAALSHTGPRQKGRKAGGGRRRQ
mmetsp:Transcript_109845/g.276331  ORF Transcript_109845/g.276331 Transcript_109845/m.276331 type:complete len:633 (-) Transcript_109845:64-1962(-)